MILATLAIVCLAVPQEPVAERLRAIHTDVDVATQVAAVEQRLTRVRDGSVAGVRTPAFVHELRASGAAAVDLVADRVAIHEEEDQVAAAFELVRSLSGLADASREVPVNPGIDEFSRVCEHAYRDLHKALGSGRNLNEVAPWLHAAVEQVRSSVANLSQIEPDQQKLLRERMARLERVEMAVILALGEQIVQTAMRLDREELIAALRKESARDPRADSGVTGAVLVDRDTAFGRLVVGGFGRNSYDMSQVEIVLDAGGNDEYRGGVAGAGELRRMSVVVDLAGDDTYSGDDDSLGSATFGIGVLVDLAGDDRYTARNRSCGYGSGGVGVFVDVAGKDSYRLGDQGAGLGFAGVGMMLDLAGDDDLEAGVQSFGVGLPGGVGLLLDTSGDDRRAARSETKALTEQGDDQVSIAFGAGVGVMPFLSGGLGAFLDLGGQDTYQAQSVAVGVGMRGGVGIFREVYGNDVYDVGAVGLGAAYAFGIGVCLEGAGDDSYRARNLSLGAASDGSLAFFVERIGDDEYFAMGPTAGAAQRGSLGACVDLRGKDAWRLAGGPAAWRVFGVEDVESSGVGIFLDEGGATDRFELSRMAPPLPTNARTRLIKSGPDEHPDLHVWVDR